MLTKPNLRHFEKTPLRHRRRGVFFRILAVLDPFYGPTGPYSFHRDTSHLLLRCLERRGHQIHYADPSSFSQEEGCVLARSAPVHVLDGSPYFEFEKESEQPVDSFSLVLIRKDPPVDAAYLHMMRLLSLVSKIPVLNRPATLMDYNEKLSILMFPKWIPLTLVTKDHSALQAFLQKCGGSAVLKDLESFAGKGVRRIGVEGESPNPVFDRMTNGGQKSVMVQAFLPKIFLGEKRLMMIDGKPAGALLKVPASGHFIANPDRGAKILPTTLTRREKQLAEAVGPFLRKNGVFFAGIDLIDEKMTEINMTSPGLVWEWNEADNAAHEEKIADALEKLCR